MVQPGDVKVEVGRKYRFIMKAGSDRWGTVRQVLTGTYVIELAKPLHVAGAAMARGSECLVDRERVERVAEVM